MNEGFAAGSGDNSTLVEVAMSARRFISGSSNDFDDVGLDRRTIDVDTGNAMNVDKVVSVGVSRRSGRKEGTRVGFNT